MDTPLTTQDPTNSSAPLKNLTEIATGTDQINRIGRQVRLKSIHLRGNIEANTAGNPAQRVRLIVVATKNSEPDNAPVLQDVLQDGGNFDSFRNLNRARGFIPIVDRTFQVDQDDPRRYFNIYKKLNIRKQFNDNSGTYTSASQGYGDIYMWAICDEDNTNEPVIALMSRVRFVDN
jgi:hypothetical protein